MKVVVHDFPPFKSVYRVEEKYCELLNKYRSGEYLDEETIDWMDSANTWLSLSKRE